MPLDNSDPNIPLQAGNIPRAFQQSFAGAGQNLNQLLALQMRAQQLRQVQQSENALRTLYGNPSNIDDQGRPTKNALAEMMRSDPTTGMKVTNMLAQFDHNRLINEAMQGEAGQRYRKAGYEILQAGRSAYADSLKATNNPQRALQVANETVAEMKSQYSSDGTLPKSYIDRISGFDPVKWNALASAYEAANTKPMTPYQQAELGINRQRVGLEGEKVDIEKANAKRGDYDPPKNVEARGPDGKTYQTTGIWDRVGHRWMAPDLTGPLDVVRETGTKTSAADKPSQPREVEYTKPDGTTDVRLAQQLPNGQWVSADERREPLPGTVSRVVKEGQASGRESTMIQRQLVDAKDATAELKNIAELPVGASTGWLGGYEPGKSLMGSVKSVLGRKVTSQEVQDYNTSAVGLGRALAGLETGGLQVNQGLMNAFDQLQLKEGDTQLTKARKLASMRQQANNALEAALVNPRMGKQQIEFAKKMVDDMKEAIPWTPHDVTMLEYSTDPKATLSDYAKSKGLAGEKKGPAAPAFDMNAPAKKGEAPPAEAFGGDERKTLTNEFGESYRLRGGKVVKVN